MYKRWITGLLTVAWLAGQAQTPPTSKPASSHQVNQNHAKSTQSIKSPIPRSKSSAKHIATSHENKSTTKYSPPLPPQNLWQQIARDFSLSHQEYRPQVQAQINWFVSHPQYLMRVASHAGYYMYYIHSQVVKRHLPGELVLLPMIESAYDPYSYSWVGAAGIWQMMPRTGLDFGLKQDWWYDARKSIIPSTKAALDYLYYLHSFFNGDWLLAAAAYNYGEGNVQASINRNASVGAPTDFWSLQLPLETESYVPRLLALAAIVANPSRYGVTLPYIPNRPYFGIVDLNQQLELNQIAQMADISSTELYELNPGFTRFATEPNTHYQLLLPTSQIPLFETNLAAVDHHAVDTEHPTETLLAQNTTPSIQISAVAAPQPSLPSSFNASPIATLPATTENPTKDNTQGTSHTPSTYIVKPHETMFSIAKNHGLTVAKLEEMNHLSNTSIKAGDVLVVG